MFIQGTCLYAMDIAITVDDLPENGILPPGITRQEVATKILNTLEKHHISGAYGFLNGKITEVNSEKFSILNQWIQAGQLLGNHGYSHLDLAKISLNEYLFDIKKNEAILAELMPNKDFHYYRYPFLAEGETTEKRNTVRQFLKDNQYQIAQVTVDFFEYEWNGPYVRCIDQSNQKALRWLRKNYITQAVNALTIAQSLSMMLYARDIKHVLLIHINAFTAEMLDELLTTYETHGVNFISLKDALSDEAYAFNPDIVRDRAYTFLNQVRLAKKLNNPKIVQQFYDSFPGEKLEFLCNRGS
jgi:peptidoglycan/xylan/chitin deacetylase (PgdA/CDA1 family)